MCCRILFGSYVSAEEEGGSKTDTDKHKEREGDRERERGKKEGDFGDNPNFSITWCAFVNTFAIDT